MKILEKSNENMAKEVKYVLTLSPGTQRMVTAKGSTLNISDWIIYEDENNGKVVEVLSVLTDDGETFATNSATFIREFRRLRDFLKDCGEVVTKIRVASGISKVGREYITCVMG